MSRDELEKYFVELNDLVEDLKHQGDFDAHAATIRRLAEAMLKVYDHLLLKHRM